jgi:hypothetical protein
MLTEYVAKIAPELGSCTLGKLDFRESYGGLGEGFGG